MPQAAIESRAYTSGQAAKATGLAYHLIDHWAKIGLIVPSVSESDGTDTCRAYAFADVVALAAAKQLRKSGLGLDSFSRAVKHLQERKYGAADKRVVLVGSDDGSVIEGELESVVSTLLRRNQRFSWVMNVGAVISEVKTALRKVNEPRRGKARRVACIPVSH